MKNDDNLLTDMPVPSAFFKLAISAFAALVSMGGAPKRRKYIMFGKEKRLFSNYRLHR